MLDGRPAWQPAVAGVAAAWWYTDCYDFMMRSDDVAADGRVGRVQQLSMTT